MIAERPPEAIQWHEGMLLAPQHFQQLTLRQERLLAYRLGLVAPWHYGVRRLRVDPSLLVAGVLRVVELEALLPDGLVVALDDDEALELALDPYQAELHKGSLRVHLAVPAHRANAAPSGELARFRSVEGPAVLDESTGEGEVRIPRLRPSARLIAGRTPPAKYVGLPLLEVTLRGENLALSDYLPPLLAVEPASPLAEALGALAGRLREKAVMLAERARSPALGASEPLTLETRRTVASLVAALPELEAALAGGHVHPAALHMVLARVAGSVAAVGEGVVPPAFPTYDHGELRRSFQPLLDFVARRIDAVATGYREVPFRREGSGFVHDLEAPLARRKLVVGARKRQGQSDAELEAWLDQCLIGSLSRIEELADRRILGARRRRIDRDDELGVLPSSQVTLFAIEADPAFVAPGAPLVIANPFDERVDGGPRELFLYAATEPAREDEARERPAGEAP
jgi:type VI secretion system protein ImpJ